MNGGIARVFTGRRPVGAQKLPRSTSATPPRRVRSDSLYRRIARLDDILFGEGAVPVAGARGQLDTLAQAFASK